VQRDLHAAVVRLEQTFDQVEGVNESYARAIKGSLHREMDQGPDVLKSGVAVLHDTLDAPGPPVVALIRLAHDSLGPAPDGTAARCSVLMSMFGLPWIVGAVVRVLETRVSKIGIHLMLGASLLMLPLLSYIPMAVLFGVFLFMGVGTLGGNQFAERVRLGDGPREVPRDPLQFVPCRRAWCTSSPAYSWPVWGSCGW
jgi:hypothetical protein